MTFAPCDTMIISHELRASHHTESVKWPPDIRWAVGSSSGGVVVGLAATGQGGELPSGFGLTVVPLTLIDVELHELDRTVGCQLTDRRDHGDEAPRGDEDAVLRPSRDELGELVEACGEPFDDGDQVVRLEVRSRRPALLPFLGQLPVEILEEGWRGTDRTALSSHEALDAPGAEPWSVFGAADSCSAIRSISRVRMTSR